MPTSVPLALVGVLGAAACSSSSAPRATTPLEKPAAAAPAAAADAANDVVIDSGRLVIAQAGMPVGLEQFELRRRGDVRVMRAQVEMNVLGQQVNGGSELVTDAGFRPLRGTSRHEVDTVVVAATLSGGPDKLALTLTTSSPGSAAGPQVREERAPGPVDVYIDNTTFARFAPLCARAADARGPLIAFPGVKITIGEVRTKGAIRTLPADIGGEMVIDVHCDGARLVGVDMPSVGLTTTREGSEAAVAAARRPPRSKPALPDGLVELDRTVAVKAKGIEPATLACALVLPSSHASVKVRGRTGPTAALPAVVFLTGSGPQDRDEDSYGPGGLKLAIFKVMAIELGQAGIASLRCDDRGTGRSTGTLMKTTLDSNVADAAAAVAALRAEPAIDPARIGMIGHAEGGVIAPVVAARDPRLRALVLMAATGRPLGAVLLEQLRLGFERSGKPADELERDLATARAIVDAIAAGKPLPAGLTEAEVASWETSRPWMRSHLLHDPAKVAARLGRLAVLIAYGEADRQVARADTDALATGFAKAKNRKVQTKLYPRLNHLFARSTTGDISEYSDPDAEVDRRFLADVVAFLKAALS